MKKIYNIFLCGVPKLSRKGGLIGGTIMCLAILLLISREISKKAKNFIQISSNVGLM